MNNLVTVSIQSEKLYKRIADAMVDGGYRDAGYVHVNIDDCWSLKERDSHHRLVADPKRFPGGMKKLAKYVSWTFVTKAINLCRD